MLPLQQLLQRYAIRTTGRLRVLAVCASRSSNDATVAAASSAARMTQQSGIFRPVAARSWASRTAVSAGKGSSWISSARSAAKTHVPVSCSRARMESSRFALAAISFCLSVSGFPVVAHRDVDCQLLNAAGVELRFVEVAVIGDRLCQRNIIADGHAECEFVRHQLATHDEAGIGEGIRLMNKIRSDGAKTQDQWGEFAKASGEIYCPDLKQHGDQNPLGGSQTAWPTAAPGSASRHRTVAAWLAG